MSKFKIFIVILIGVSIPLYVLWKIVLVEFNYSSISAAQSGVKLTFQEIDTQKLLVFPEEENYFFDKIKLEIKFKENSKIPAKLDIKAYQNFLVNFYPLVKGELEEDKLRSLLFQGNSTNLPIGSLFFNGDAISIMLPNNSYRSIFSAELFEKMGYRWDDVISKEVGFAGRLEKKENFLYGNAHPDGTFLEVDNNFFLIWDKKIFPIESSLNPNDFSKTTPIKIDSLETNYFDNCQIKLQENKAVCFFSKKDNLIKSNYVFISNNLSSQDIEEAKISLSTNPSIWSLQNNFLVSIDNIKLKLIKKYRGYIPFI